MDLAEYLRVLSRFRALVLGGLVLACLLAFLSYAGISFAGGSPKLTYRQSEQWESTTRILISQPGFPLGKLSVGNPSPTPSTTTTPFASPQWLASLAVPFAQLGNSDAVQNRLWHGTPPSTEQMTVVAEFGGSNNSEALPVLDVNGLGPSPGAAVHVAQRGAAVFIKYFRQQQRVNKVATANRVQLQVLNRATAAQLLVGRKKTVPIVIFVAVMTAAIGLAFILENLRPRIRVVSAEPDEEPVLRERVSA